jgi:hypothetical protein
MMFSICRFYSRIKGFCRVGEVLLTRFGRLVSMAGEQRSGETGAGVSQHKVAMSKTVAKFREEIARRAYELWEAGPAGMRRHGRLGSGGG